MIHAILALPSLRQEGSVRTPQSEICSNNNEKFNSKKKKNKQMKAVSDLYKSLKRKFSTQTLIDSYTKIPNHYLKWLFLDRQVSLSTNW